MKNTTVIIVLVLLILFGIYYFVLNTNKSTVPPGNSQTNTPPAANNKEVNTNPAPSTPAPTPSNPPAPAQSSVTLNIKDFSFNPATISIKAGTKVTWTNNDSVPHTVTSDLGTLLDSPTLSPGQSFSFTFINSGSVDYHCAIHPMMKGKIIVQN